MVSYQVACADNARVEFSGDSGRRGDIDNSDFVEENYDYEC